jgi:hypothetical protein
MQKVITILGFLILATVTNGQVLKKFPFEKYSVKAISTKKAGLDLKSHILGQKYKTVITESYRKENVNFGGHYIVIVWGEGAGLSGGILADINTGKLYDLPLTEKNSYRGSSGLEQNNNIKHNKNSRLFVCYNSEDLEENVTKLNYYYYEFNEKIKKFKLIKTKTTEFSESVEERDKL